MADLSLKGAGYRLAGAMVSGSKQRKPSFFKVLLKDFKTKLRIPDGSVGSFGSHESVILTNLTTENRYWAVSLNMTGNGGLRFQGKGWVDFVKDNTFSKGDILIFAFEEDALLRVSAFGKTSCLKTPNTKNGPPADKSPASHFEVTFERFNLFGLHVPPEFVMETGMKNRDSVVVKDWEGREWPVQVTKQSNGEILLGDGWADFVKQNGLRIGKTCIFQSLLNAADDDVLVLLAYPCDDTPYCSP